MRHLTGRAIALNNDRAGASSLEYAILAAAAALIVAVGAATIPGSAVERLARQAAAAASGAEKPQTFSARGALEPR
jgi:Flp pilus assembly pilin Flp